MNTTISKFVQQTDLSYENKLKTLDLDALKSIIRERAKEIDEIIEELKSISKKL